MFLVAKGGKGTRKPSHADNPRLQFAARAEPRFPVRGCSINSASSMIPECGLCDRGLTNAYSCFGMTARSSPPSPSAIPPSFSWLRVTCAANGIFESVAAVFRPRLEECSLLISCSVSASRKQKLEDAHAKALCALAGCERRCYPLSNRSPAVRELFLFGCALFLALQLSLQPSPVSCATALLHSSIIFINVSCPPTKGR